MTEVHQASLCGFHDPGEEPVDDVEVVTVLLFPAPIVTDCCSLYIGRVFSLTGPLCMYISHWAYCVYRESNLDWQGAESVFTMEYFTCEEIYIIMSCFRNFISIELKLFLMLGLLFAYIQNIIFS